MKIDKNKRPTITKTAQRVIDSVISDLQPTPYRDPIQTDKIRDTILDCVDDAVKRYKSSGHITINYLSSSLFDCSRSEKYSHAQEELEGLAQIFGILTGQKEGMKYFPKALQLENYDGDEPDWISISDLEIYMGEVKTR